MAWHYLVTAGYEWQQNPHSPDQTDNATEIWNFLNNRSWTDNAKAGVLGNGQHEGYLNPGQWQHGHYGDFNYGFGMFQWDDATKVSNYVGSTNFDDMANGELQMHLLVEDASPVTGQPLHGTQWSTYYLNSDGTSTYYGESGLPYVTSLSQFLSSNYSIEIMTKLWAICWERPNNTAYANSIQGRINDAKYWYDTLHGTPPTPPSTYSIRKVSSGPGSLGLSATQAQPGDTITITVSPDAGSTCTRLYLRYGGADHDLTPAGTVQFTMPASNVIVIGIFDDEPEPPTFPLWLLFKFTKNPIM